ncbi:hypothetical protein SAMN05421677_10292 [Halobacillus aidingensis]|uniref:Uncharacterized protein n=1 Tax=Halobacillus aidingensis TaxID=240303 RepID=A0A1H0FRT2_HALAD|nr:hypothetical protein SAMN05421677_10292 [Halobacillus aidingensis]
MNTLYKRMGNGSEKQRRTFGDIEDFKHMGYSP